VLIAGVSRFRRAIACWTQRLTEGGFPRFSRSNPAAAERPGEWVCLSGPRPISFSLSYQQKPHLVTANGVETRAIMRLLAAKAPVSVKVVRLIEFSRGGVVFPGGLSAPRRHSNLNRVISPKIAFRIALRITLPGQAMRPIGFCSKMATSSGKSNSSHLSTENLSFKQT
jgi:hypothetical protein